MTNDETFKAAMNLNVLAELRHTQGKYSEAEMLYIKALSMYRGALKKEDDLNVANILNNLGRHYYDTGAYKEAKVFFEAAINIRQKLATPGERPTLAHLISSLNSLAAIYHTWMEYDEALKCYEEALNQPLSDDSLEKVQCVANQNRLLMAQYRTNKTYYQTAQRAYQRVLELSRQLFGEDHPQVATGLNNLAELYRVQKEYERARPLYEEAKAIYQKKAWDTYPAHAYVLSNYAVFLQEQGDKLAASQYYKQALKLYEQLHLYKCGADQSFYRVADVLSNYAQFAFDVKEYKQAMQRYREALEIYKGHLGRGYERVYNVLDKYKTIVSFMHGNTPDTDQFIERYAQELESSVPRPKEIVTDTYQINMD